MKSSSKKSPAAALKKSSARILPTDDPQPQPPRQPEFEDCCNGGCDPCIFDLYEQAMDRYRVQLAAWELQQAKLKP
ncbi:oxidoreductase-like domain-containing protein [Herbaspirillum lusitanum]|jgi:hypothetical protein|uniref:oxidoreductase-like domain-containing protein n=1 Tax=Herbaspirillum lusitanum TaxID=213312 RepID=UPI0038B73477